MRIDDCRGVTSRSGVARFAGLIALACACTLGPGGCASDSPQGSATLQPGEFRSAEGAPAAPAPPPVKKVAVHEAAAGFLDLTSLPGAPSTMAPAVTETGEEVIVDQFVGQINGRAMMASEFFGEGFGERLRAMGKDEAYIKRPADWQRDVGQLIHQHLLEKVRDGLLLDEVYAAMTPEVRQQGLRYFLDQLRGDLIRNNQGSAQLANERLEQESGKTMDEVVKDKRDLALMRSLLETKVRARVNVSWQQVINEYERLHREAKQQRTARFRVIVVGEKDAQAAALVKAELDGGASFADVSESKLNQFQTSEGLRYLEAHYKGDAATASIFRPTVLNAAAQGLSVGQTAGPIAFNGQVYWINLESVKSPDIESLYDSQLAILEKLRRVRTAQEENHYIQQLMDKSSRTPMLLMEDRLLSIAVSRYAPRGKS